MDAQGNTEHSMERGQPCPRDGEIETRRLGSPRSDAPIDAHVHIVGNGLRGSGCWLKVGAWHRPLASFMLRHIGVGVSTSAPEFDAAYAAHLARLVRQSSLDAAVILAQD